MSLVGREAGRQSREKATRDDSGRRLAKPMKQIVNDDWTLQSAAATVWLFATHHLSHRGVGMDGYHVYPDPALRGKTPWPLIASSLWLRLGFVAASGAAVGLMELYQGELSSFAGLAWIFGGAWLAALSWRRAIVLLERLDGVDVVPEDVMSEVIASEPTPYPSWDRREVGAAPVGSQARG
jgi:hypothetical protein